MVSKLVTDPVGDKFVRLVIDPVGDKLVRPVKDHVFDRSHVFASLLKFGAQFGPDGQIFTLNGDSLVRIREPVGRSVRGIGPSLHH